MNAAEINKLETTLNLTLPATYRDILLDHPFPDSHTFNFQLLGDVDTLIETNIQLRKEGFFGHPWDPTWLALGWDGCGNHEFITTNPHDGNIYSADHEMGFAPSILEENLLHESFDEFIKELQITENEILEDEKQELQKSQNRKWWQFWIPKPPTSPEN